MPHDHSAIRQTIQTFIVQSQAVIDRLSGPPQASVAGYQRETGALIIGVLASAATLARQADLIATDLDHVSDDCDELRLELAALRAEFDAHTHDQGTG